MQAVNFREGHKVLSQDEHCKGYSLELEIAFLFESYDCENHNHCSLKGGLPEPDEEVYS